MSESWQQNLTKIKSPIPFITMHATLVAWNGNVTLLEWGPRELVCNYSVDDEYLDLVPEI